MNESRDTTNPTKSPCDPYIFNTVLTRSKSLVVVVGNPVALLNIESHMKTLYGKKAQCWSSFIRVCLENDSFLVPLEVEPDPVKRCEFELRLKAELFDNSDVSNMHSQLVNFLTLKQQPLCASAATNFPNRSPAKHTADASRYPASSLAKPTSKPPQKSAVAVQGKFSPKKSPLTAKKQLATKQPVSKQLQSSSTMAGKVSYQEQAKSVASQQFQQGSPSTARRVSEQHHSLSVNQGSSQAARRISEQHHSLSVNQGSSQAARRVPEQHHSLSVNQGSSQAARRVSEQHHSLSVNQGSSQAARRVSEQHHSLSVNQGSSQVARRVPEQHHLLPHVPLAESLPQQVAFPCKSTP